MLLIVFALGKCYKIKEYAPSFYSTLDSIYKHILAVRPVLPHILQDMRLLQIRMQLMRILEHSTTNFDKSRVNGQICCYLCPCSRLVPILIIYSGVAVYHTQLVGLLSKLRLAADHAICIPTGSAQFKHTSLKCGLHPDFLL